MTIKLSDLGYPDDIDHEAPFRGRKFDHPAQVVAAWEGHQWGLEYERYEKERRRLNPFYKRPLKICKACGQVFMRTEATDNQCACGGLIEPMEDWFDDLRSKRAPFRIEEGIRCMKHHLTLWVYMPGRWEECPVCRRDAKKAAKESTE